MGPLKALGVVYLCLHSNMDLLDPYLIDDGVVESYVGLAKNFKKRFSKHKANLASRSADGQTTLSRYVHKTTDNGLNP